MLSVAVLPCPSRGRQFPVFPESAAEMHCIHPDIIGSRTLINFDSGNLLHQDQDQLSTIRHGRPQLHPPSLASMLVDGIPPYPIVEQQGTSQGQDKRIVCAGECKEGEGLVEA